MDSIIKYISNWYSRQWTDIRGNLKWAFVYWLGLGGGMTWLAHHLQFTLHANLAGWLSLAAPIFSILAVAYLVVIVVGRNNNRTATPPSEEPTTGALAAIQNALPAPPALQKGVDLQGEIRELYIQSFEDMLHFSKTYVVMKVRITNHGPDEATVTGCGIRISLGDYQINGDVKNDIPVEWRIKKKRQGILGIAYDETPIEELLSDKCVYKKGHPNGGWLAFEVVSSGDIEFPNAQVELLLQDSLGGRHYITREAGVYPRTGELVMATQKLSPTGRL
jgi:hypothetical protein